MFNFAAATAAVATICAAAFAITNPAAACWPTSRHVETVWNTPTLAEYEANAFTEADVAALPAAYQPFAAQFVGTTKAGALALKANLDCQHGL